MKLKKAIIVTDGICDIYGKASRVAGWRVATTKTKSTRADICRQCASCLVAVIAKLNEVIGE